MCDMHIPGISISASRQTVRSQYNDYRKNAAETLIFHC